MSILAEYIDKKLSVAELESELQRLIKEYNSYRSTYLFVYASSNMKPIPNASLEQDDYYIIADILKNETKSKRLDFYLETPGGSGETAEDIVNSQGHK
ncbi:MAG: hypothetical protein AB1295_03670 [Candidatus Micrarchaeota archaeon]